MSKYGIDAVMFAPVRERIESTPSAMMEKHLISDEGPENKIRLAAISSWVISVECTVLTRDVELDWIPRPSVEFALQGSNHKV